MRGDPELTKSKEKIGAREGKEKRRINARGTQGNVGEELIRERSRVRIWIKKAKKEGTH